MRGRNVVVGVVCFLVAAVNLQPVEACPGSCICSTSTWGATVICQGGNIGTIVSSVPPDTKSLKIVSPAATQTLTNSYFNSIKTTQLTELSVNFAKITAITDDTFNSDNLINLNALDLSSNNIISIGANAFNSLRNLRSLNLSHNSLNEIGDIFLNLRNVRLLDLGYNRITGIQTGNFRQQTNLESLILDGNKLSNLHGYVFQGLQNLKTLGLHNCEMAEIHDDLFSIIRNIRSIDLEGNSITSLPPSEKLRNLPFLKIFLLGGNKITEIDDLQFSGLSFVHLKLSRNKITHIKKNSFKYFNVKHLDLSYNEITTLSAEMLKPTAPQLETLNLAGNPLTSVSSDVFKGLYRLTSLNMSASHLTNLEEKQFNLAAKSLKIIDLSWNDLHFIPEGVINIFRSMEKVYIHGNFWNCDCTIKPLYNWLLDHDTMKKLYCPQSKTVDTCSEPKCATPQSLSRQSVVLLTEEQSNRCDIDDEGSRSGLDSIQITILAMCIALALILCFVIFLLYRRVKSKGANLVLCGKAETDKSPKKKSNITKTGPNAFDEKIRRPFAYDSDNFSLNFSDKSFVMKKYLNHLPTDPKSMKKPIFNDSQYESQSSLDSNEDTPYQMGKESAV